MPVIIVKYDSDCTDDDEFESYACYGHHACTIDQTRILAIQSSAPSLVQLLCKHQIVGYHKGEEYGMFIPM